MSDRYELALAPDDNGTLLVTCPALPEVASFGDNRTEAMAHGGLAVEEAIAARMANWQDVPPGDASVGSYTVELPLLASVKLLLYRQCRASDVTRAELARRLGWHREQVDRLFRLEHASRLDQIEAAFRALGRTVDIAVRDAA
jgi:antitoxin HicB